MGGLPPDGKPGGTMNYKSSMMMADGMGRGNIFGRGMQAQADAWKKYDDAQAVKKTSGKAKVRKADLVNTPDKTRSRKKVFSTTVSSGGVGKKSKSSSPTGGRVAALLKTKDTNNNKDSGDKLG